VGINGVKVAKDIYEQRQVPFLSYYKAGRFPPLMQLAQQIRDRVPANAVVLAPQRLGRVLTYFSHRNVLDTWEWDCFQAKGLLAYIVMPPDDDDPNFAPFVRQRGLKVGSCIAKVDRSSDRGKSLPSYWTLHGLIVPGAQPGSN
jgi:hypothetical protein